MAVTWDIGLAEQIRMNAGDAGETAWNLHGSGPAVALIHSFGLDRAMWQ